MDVVAQQKAMAAEEARKQKEEKEARAREERLRRRNEKKLLKIERKHQYNLQLVRKHLAREVKYDALTHEKASGEWYALLDQIKIKECRQEVEKIFAEVNEMMDRKDNCLERLKENQKQASDQYQRAVQGHADFIQMSIDLFNVLSKALRNNYENNVEQILTSYREDVNFRDLLNDRIKTNAENVMHVTTAMYINNINEIKLRYRMLNEALYENAYYDRYLRSEKFCLDSDKLFQEVKDMYDQINEDIIKPKGKTNQHVLAVLKVDEALFENIKEKQKKYHRMYQKLQVELSDLKLNTTEKLVHLHQEHQYFYNLYFKMKRQYLNDIKKDDTAIRVLVQHSSDAIMKLKQRVHHGKLIMSSIGVCRKLQTEKETIMACPYESTVPVTEMTAAAITRMENSTQDTEYLKKMEIFWNRVAYAENHCLALAEEKSKLLFENKRAKHMLKKYCHEYECKLAIDSLMLNGSPTVTVPLQEASHIFQRSTAEQIKNAKSKCSNGRQL